MFEYEIIDIQNRNMELKRISSTHQVVASQKELHIGWCLIDAKSIEKILPSLSEIGVSKISFISCERSQKNFKLDTKRFNRILEASMQQCGRSTYIEFDTYKDIRAFIKEFPQTKVFDFTDKTLDEYTDIKTVLIGCEGGFSQNERALLKEQDIFRLNTPMILRSESAVMAVASKVLL
ncbi:MAG: RsmE family RNA methyltransferase [Sulfurimonas sp.]|nr:RsmE family RNA methyltransferase [Sulfurimonas sp.]